MLRKYRISCVVLITALMVAASASGAEKPRLTTYKEMMTRLASLQTVDNLLGSDRIRVVSIGRSVQGREIPLVVVYGSGMQPELTKRLFVICRQHGDEPASTEGMLNLVESLAFSHLDETADLLSKVSFYIVPMMNPDGAERYQRRNMNGADLNRDWLNLSQPETRSVRAAVDSVAPDVLIDAHELSPRNNSADFVETAGMESGTSPEVVSGCLELQDLIMGMLRTHDMYVESCQIDDRHPARLAHRYFPVHRSMQTLLLESRQAGGRQYQLGYRMNLHIIGTMTVAKYLAGREDELRQRIAQSDHNRRLVQLASRKGKRAATSNGKPKK